ncbi:hypothetical protein TTHERM_000628348 (macronuclear) [Tetrahymena thermophila SB210]|uniref:Uncharacterized protein n=1 Tax=Tetrahymena thermophila (strain SB210) TaxID=312017 RepID=W7XGX7_TETTS|nr:hypothetical protein TTHERM_000628348 [Tetrahymena thermophila SB210]EWS73531.1 hypothetical protein TTHERM_000628348 [Tetrahymena thermophila SB210]|eukprot:XP_012653921.1 hypothetical protein TTHERM_000628348 [Tetrahymena thermophila SB210]
MNLKQGFLMRLMRLNICKLLFYEIQNKSKDRHSKCRQLILDSMGIKYQNMQIIKFNSYSLVLIIAVDKQSIIGYFCDKLMISITNTTFCKHNFIDVV